MLNRMKILQIEQFAFEQAKEILDDGTVQTVAFSAHALNNTIVGQCLLMLFVLILPALI